MKKDASNIIFLIVFIGFLVTISAYLFVSGNQKWLRIYMAFLVAIWILTLSIWPWWDKNDKKKEKMQRIKAKISKKQIAPENKNLGNSIMPSIELEENSSSEILLSNFEIRTNPQAKEIPYKEN